jgi:hypothetical protein
LLLGLLCFSRYFLEKYVKRAMKGTVERDSETDSAKDGENYRESDNRNCSEKDNGNYSEQYSEKESENDSERYIDHVMRLLDLPWPPLERKRRGYISDGAKTLRLTYSVLDVTPPGGETVASFKLKSNGKVHSKEA